MAETLINGYHLLQFCGKDYGESVSYSVLENDLGEGYTEGVLFGSNCGNRQFSIGFSNVANFTSAATYELNGVMYTPAQYLWELFCLWKLERKPIVIQSTITNQYYLCRFIDQNFSLQKALTALYSGQAVFQQLRVSGATVFDPSKLDLWGWYDADDFDTVGRVWADGSGNANDFFRPSGGTDYVKTTDVINGQTTLKFNSAAGSSFLQVSAGATFKELYAVLKINEATFSGDLGIITGGASDTTAFLIGANTTTRFYDLNYDAAQTYFYSKGGTEYAESNAQAPMNAFALVYIRLGTGIAMTDIRLGRDRNTANYGKFEIAEFALTTTQLPTTQRNELLEHLAVKYAL